MATDSKITDWHRSFGLAIEGDFSDYPFEILREKDMSTQEEYLDVLIINTKRGTYPTPLPDGLENLKSYNLITYKSLHESLNAWTIEELIGHYVSYRKMLSSEDKKKKLPPEEDFQLYAICTIHPQKLLKQHKHKRIKKGVYELTWGAKKICIIVLSAVPKSRKNALWNIFSNVKKNIEYGLTQYRMTRPGSKLVTMSSVIDDVFKYYGVEGLHMAYTMEQYQKDYFVRKLPEFLDDDKMQDGIFQTISNYLTTDDILARLVARGRLSIDTILSFFPAKDIVSHLSPGERKGTIA